MLDINEVEYHLENYRLLTSDEHVQPLRDHIEALEDENARLRQQVEAADALADAIAAARVENTDWTEFNALLAALTAYRRATATATAEVGRGER